MSLLSSGDLGNSRRLPPNDWRRRPHRAAPPERFVGEGGQLADAVDVHLRAPLASAYLRTRRVANSRRLRLCPRSAFDLLRSVCLARPCNCLGTSGTCLRDERELGQFWLQTPFPRCHCKTRSLGWEVVLARPHLASDAPPRPYAPGQRLLRYLVNRRTVARCDLACSRSAGRPPAPRPPETLGQSHQQHLDRQEGRGGDTPARADGVGETTRISSWKRRYRHSEEARTPDPRNPKKTPTLRSGASMRLDWGLRCSRCGTSVCVGLGRQPDRRLCIRPPSAPPRCPLALCTIVEHMPALLLRTSPAGAEQNRIVTALHNYSLTHPLHIV